MRSTIYIVDDAVEYRLLLEKTFIRFLPQYDVQFFASGNAHCDAVATGSLPRPPDLLRLDCAYLTATGWLHYRSSGNRMNGLLSRWQYRVR